MAFLVSVLVALATALGFPAQPADGSGPVRRAQPAIGGGGPVGRAQSAIGGGGPVR